MTNWCPRLANSGPRYRAIAEALAQDIASGKLKAGARLPAQRDLAWDLKVTLGTVTRAYQEAERRGLIFGKVGRGTFVRAQAPETPYESDRYNAQTEVLNLSSNYPCPTPEARQIFAALNRLAERGLEGEQSGQSRLDGVTAMLDYRGATGDLSQRRAGIEWLQRSGLEAREEEVLPTQGAQHAMAVTLAALCPPDSVVLTESLTFFGMRNLAKTLSLRLYGVEMDEYGLRPDALDAACRSTGSQLLYSIPTLQNPTTAIMPEGRRREIAEVCRKYGVVLLEDDIYGFLHRDVTPLSGYLQEQSVYVTSLSKAVTPALRVGYLRAKADLRDKIAGALYSFGLMTNSLMQETAGDLIASGAADRLSSLQAREVTERHQLAKQVLGRMVGPGSEASMHVWLKLPDHWNSQSFVDAALKEGVALTAAEFFAVGQETASDCVRVCLAAAPNQSLLLEALQKIRRLMDHHPEPRLPLL